MSRVGGVATGCLGECFEHPGARRRDVTRVERYDRPALPGGQPRELAARQAGLADAAAAVDVHHHGQAGGRGVPPGESARSRSRPMKRGRPVCASRFGELARGRRAALDGDMRSDVSFPGFYASAVLPVDQSR